MIGQSQVIEDFPPIYSNITVYHRVQVFPLRQHPGIAVYPNNNNN